MNALAFAVEALILMKIGTGGEEEAGSHLMALRHHDDSSKERAARSENVKLFSFLGCWVYCKGR